MGCNLASALSGPHCHKSATTLASWARYVEDTRQMFWSLKCVEFSLYGSDDQHNTLQDSDLVYQILLAHLEPGSS